MLKKHFKFFLFLLFSFFVAAIIGFYVGLLLSQWNFVHFLLQVMPQTKVSPADNILVLGIDEVEGSSRSDSIIIINVNRATKKIGLLSIPRDSRIDIQGVGLDKINHAYVYGGIELLKESLSNFLEIPIQYHVVLSLQGVKDLVDEIGGIELDVQNRMYYVDKAGDLFIDFYPGEQILDGEETASYLRFRHDRKGDIGRIQRQQQFIKAVVNKMLLPSNLIKIPKLVNDKDKYIETNLGIGQILGLVVEFKDSLERGDLKVNTLPGSVVIIDNVYYWKVDTVASVKLVNETLHGFHEEMITKRDTSIKVNLANNDLGQPKVLTLVEMKKYMPKDKEKLGQKDTQIFERGVTVTVEVLNGNGISGSAAKVASILEERGVAVPRVENGAHFRYEKTIIVDWKGNSAESLRLAKAMNIDPAHIIIYNKPEKSIDVSIVLGKDWQSLTGVN
jgi:polyisoprenyl-teichoic acid--peptidoglycan teichoic acid transferase